MTVRKKAALAALCDDEVPVLFIRISELPDWWRLAASPVVPRCVLVPPAAAKEAGAGFRATSLCFESPVFSPGSNGRLLTGARLITDILTVFRAEIRGG